MIFALAALLLILLVRVVVPLETIQRGSVSILFAILQFFPVKIIIQYIQRVSLLSRNITFPIKVRAILSYRCGRLVRT